MNKFHEFDKIKTPEDWKKIDVNDIKSSSKVQLFPKLSLVFVCVLFICSSIGFVYAVNDHFRQWVYEQFHSQNIEEIIIPEDNEHMRIEDIFMYTYYESHNQEIIKDVSVFKNGQFVLSKPQYIEGRYGHQNYSFEYVIEKDHIFAFHEKGFVFDVLPLMKDHLIYFASNDNNLCSLNMETNEIIKITNDNDSVNFKISSNKKYISINKNDKYWTVYNTDTKQEELVENLNGYLHSGEYSFIGDRYIVDAYSNIYDLENHESWELDDMCIYPEASTFSLKFDESKTIIIENLYHDEIVIDYDLYGYCYGVLNNRFIIFDSLEDKKTVIVDFENKKYRVFDYKGNEQYVSMLIIDNEYLLLSNDREYFIVPFSEIFQ